MPARERVTYDYRDANGVVRFQVVREPGKRFWQRHQVGGAWMSGRGDSPWLLYRLPELLKADASAPVFICEGEKDVDTVRALGAVATCNPCGAGKWKFVADLARGVLEGREVVVVADNDDEGRGHAEDVRSRLEGIARRVQVMRAPRPHKDVTELVEAGGGLNQLVAIDAAEEPVTGVVEKPKPDPWNLMTAEQILAPLPEYPWLVKGLHMAPGRVTLLAGTPDSGKTVVAQGIALGVASGRAIWGVYRPTKRGKVVHLNGEIGTYIARERYQRLARAMGLTLQDIADTLVLSNYPDAKLDDPDFEARLMVLCEGASLVIVDSLRAFSGELDEMKKEIGVALLMLARVSDKTGAMFIVLHHNRKPSREGKTDGRKSDEMSGNNSIFGGCECAFVLTKDKNGPVTVHHERSPIGKPMKDFGLSIEDVADGNEPRWGLTIRHLEPEQMAREADAARAAKAAEVDAEIEKTVLDFLTKHAGIFRGSRERLREACGVRREVFGKAFQGMLVKGAIYEGGTYHKPEFSISPISPVTPQSLPGNDIQSPSNHPSPPFLGRDGWMDGSDDEDGEEMHPVREGSPSRVLSDDENLVTGDRR
jgi:5S rRNA maturation endonuclease (ribonuclease M5)